MTRIGITTSFICLLLLQTCFAGAIPEGMISLPGRPAPELTLADMDGKTSSLASSQGHWSFVHFWASWCGPCRKELPSIARLLEEMKGQDMAFFIINTAEGDDTVFEFLAANAPDLNTLMDRDGLATEAWQPRGLPATYLVDPHGMIRYQALGGRNWQATAYRDFLLDLISSK